MNHQKAVSSEAAPLCPYADVTASNSTYDALGRQTQVTAGDSSYAPNIGTTTYSYAQNDVLVTVGPAATGETAKKRQLEYDAAGRLTSVCEITTTLPGYGTCGQTNPQSGFWTKYTYDGIDNLATIVQNAQGSPTESRSYNYDALSRMVSESNPETGTTSYYYDSDATCGPASAGDLLRRVDGAGNVTCYAYDALHRNTAITYPGGPFAANTDEKHFVYDTSTFTFGTSLNSMGRLAEAHTGPRSSKKTDLGFYYSVRGEVSDTYELTPHSNGNYYQIVSGYWANGAPQTMRTNIAGLPNWTFNPDGEGRIVSITPSSGQSPLTGTTYGPYGVTNIAFGSGDSDGFGFDPKSGRQTSYAFAVNGSTETGTLTWNLNGSLQKLVISDPFSSANNQTCTNSYDDLARLVSNNCGTTWSNSFSYDAFGNMKKSGSSSFVPTYNTANQYATLPSGTPSYASNGVVNNDGLHSYYWDSDNKNVRLDASLTMTYDALGRWVERNNNGVYSQAVYGPDGSEVAVMSGQSVISYYLRLPGGATAVYNSGGLNNYWHPDWLGTPRLYSSPTRTVLADLAFGAYGEQYQGPVVDSMFTGVAQVPEANDLRTFPARNLSTVEGRWMSPDPAGLSAVDLGNPQSLNRYAYVVGNPFGLVDPTGTTDCDPWSGCQYYGNNDGGYGGSDGYSGVTQGDCFSASSSAPCGGFPGVGINIPLPGHGPGGGTVGQPNPPVVTPPASSSPTVNFPRGSNFPGWGNGILAGAAIPVYETGAIFEDIVYGVVEAAGGLLCVGSGACEIAAAGAVVVGAVGTVIYMSQHGRGDTRDTGVMQEVYSRFPKIDICTALDTLMNEAKVAGNATKQKAIKATQKYYGCRGARNF